MSGTAEFRALWFDLLAALKDAEDVMTAFAGTGDVTDAVERELLEFLVGEFQSLRTRAGPVMLYMEDFGFDLAETRAILAARGMSRYETLSEAIQKYDSGEYGSEYDEWDE